MIIIVIQIRFLLEAAAEARDNLADSANKSLDNKDSSKTSCAITNAINTFQNWLTESSTDSQVAAFNAAEKAKASNQLDYARIQFANFFDVRDSS